MILKKEYPEYFHLLRGKKEFSGFTTEEMITLQKTATVKTFNKGQILFDQGDERNRFYFLLEGLVRTERFDENGEFSYYEYVKKDYGFPYRGMFRDLDYSYTVRAMTNITIVIFPMNVLETLLKRNGQMMQRVIEEMGQIINENENQLQVMVASSATDRVKHALTMFARNLGEQDANGRIQVPYSLTIIEIAQVSATTRETASTVLSILQDEGQLKYAHKKLTFFNQTVE